MPERVAPDGSTEILRQASAALRGMPITLWEAGGDGRFEPRAEIGGDAVHAPDAIAERLRRWNVPIPRGSRWISGVADQDHWIIAPVREHPPAPPPGGRERRRPERFILELAGTCLGLRERVAREAQLGEELRGTAALFRVVTETATDGIIAIDEHSRMLFANPAAQAIFGYREAELVGQSLTMLMPERMRHRHLAALHRYAGSGRPSFPWRAVNLTGQHRDGRELDLEVSLSEFRQAGRRAFTGILRDVTARRRGERVQTTLYRISEASAQAESLEELLHAVHRIIGDLMPATNFSVALLDPATGLLGFPYHVDERNTDYRPRPPGRGAPAYVLRSGRPLLLTPALLREMVRAGDLEATAESAVSWLGVPLILRETTIGVVAVQSYDPRVRHTDADIGVLQFVSTHVAQAIERVRAVEQQAQHLVEQQRLEDQLHQAQKMEAIGQLAGGVSHDFSNILTVILASADSAIERLAPEHPARTDVEEMREAALRGAEMTRQLLAFSRRQPMALRDLDLHELVRNLERMLRRLVPEAILLRLGLEAPHPWVRTDPAQLERVLVNLVVNARDAMPSGGHLTIRTANVPLGPPEPGRPFAVPAGGYVLLTVSDTGIGMDEATLARIFDPFFTTKPAGAGTGLGLATAYGIVKQSGGWIWAQSAPGHGATFSVCLPEREAPAGLTPQR